MPDAGQNRKARPRWILLGLLALPLVPGATWAQGDSHGKSYGAPLKAEVHAVKREPIELAGTMVGSLRAIESVTQVSELPRRLLKISEKEGSEVAANDLLFKLDDNDRVAELDEIVVKVELANLNKGRFILGYLQFWQFDLMPRAVTTHTKANNSACRDGIAIEHVGGPIVGIGSPHR